MDVQAENDALNRLLRVQMTAVNQQFSHILALEVLKEPQFAARITQVDDEDFKCAMGVLELLVTRGAEVRLAPDQMCIGVNVPEILTAEAAVEQRFSGVLAAAEVSSAEARALVGWAREPRADYQDWLAQAGSGGELPAGGEADALIGQLIVMMEQALVHAYQRWHEGDTAGADRAWQICGAAMIYITQIVKRAALEGVGIGAIAVPAQDYAGSAEDAFAKDKAMAAQCGALAGAAEAACPNPKLARVYRQVAEDSARIADGDEFAAVLGKSPVFADFSAARVRAQRS